MAKNALTPKPADPIAEKALQLWPCTSFYIYGENEDYQKQCFLETYKEIKPRDPLEEEWVLDIFDFTWTVKRLRDLRASLLNAAAHLGLERILTPLIGPTDAVTLARDWRANDGAAKQQVNEILVSAALPMSTVMAETLAIRLLEVERIDRMILDNLAGRSASLREIERHRSAMARHLRSAIGQVEDAEFKEVNDGSNGKPS